MRVEDFLNEYFRARTEVQRAIADLRAPLDAKFLAPALRPSVTDEMAKQGADEKVLTVQHSNGEAQVTTTGAWTLPRAGAFRFRYTVSKTNDECKITQMEVECAVCHGAGKLTDAKSDCKHCGSKGWFPLGEKQNA